MVSRLFRRDGKGQTAIADAIIALIILSIASTIIYSAVSATVSDRSTARQRSDLRSVAMQSASLPLEASHPNATFKEVASGKVHVLLNKTGDELLRIYFDMRKADNGTMKAYDLSGLETAIAELYQWTLEGRSFAVNARCGGMTLLFSSKADVGIKELSGIPDPRVVVQRTVHDPDGNISVDLYIWR